MGSIGSKIREKIRSTLGPSISGTKYDREKLIFSTEREGQSDRDGAYNIDINLIKNLKYRVHHS